MIAIIGGGWFGCHIAACLQKRGVSFTLFEASDRLFNGASGYNQNRLHLGFHYPRSAVTRRQSFEFAQTFMREYPTLSRDIDHNIYAVVSGESLMDWETYRQVVNGPPWAERDPAQFGLRNVEGCLDCTERVILTNKAREYFTRQLQEHLHLGERFEVTRCADFQHIINCTYQTWNPAASDLVYEPCVTLIYETECRDAITLMDGPFYSIYPFEDGTATLYSVRHSRLRVENASDPEGARRRLDAFAMSLGGARWLIEKMEEGISNWLPSFRDRYKYAGWHNAVRAISRDASAARVCKVVQQGNVIHVMSGKIDSIFHAESEVMRCLQFS